MIYNILISGIIALITMFGAYKYIPLSFYEGGSPVLGTSITTIQGTDTLSGSRTTINNNFTALNSGKIEVSTTTLPNLTTLVNLTTIGTITSGTWTGSVIDVARQGTGTTTPTLNQLMIGNGASGFKVVGLGGNGQFLTSGGAGSAPSWTTASVDETGNYNWTGTTLVKNLNASSTSANPITLNTVAYNTPSAQGASGTSLQNDGSGNLTWKLPVKYTLIGQTDLETISGWATSTMLTIPAGIMNASSTITVRLSLSCIGGTSNFAQIVNQNGTPFIVGANMASNCGTTPVSESATIDIFPNNSVSSQKSNWYGAIIQNGVATANANAYTETTSSFDLSQAFSIGIAVYSNGNSNSVLGYSIIVNP